MASVIVVYRLQARDTLMNEYSHPVEALEYALQGEGEGRSALARAGGFDKTHTAKIKVNVF